MTSTTPINEAPSEKHVRVAVPSNCVFYAKDVSAIYARPFHLGDLNAMSTAKNANDLPSFMRAIGKTLSIPVEQVTQDDFQAICYWHRINSFPRKPLMLTWQCMDSQHNAQANKVLGPDATQEELDAVADAKSSLRNRVTVQNKDIVVNSITRERFEAIRAFLVNPERHSRPYLLLPPTVGDLIEFSEIAKLELRHKKINDMELNEENLEAVLDEITEMTADDLIVRTASLLAPTHGATLSERIALVKEQIELNPDQFNADFLCDLEEYEALVDHSVSEQIKTKCKHRGCGQATVDITIDFDLFNFFPLV